MWNKTKVANIIVTKSNLNWKGCFNVYVFIIQYMRNKTTTVNIIIVNK